MAKLYKVIVNAKGTEAKEVKVLQGASEKGDPIHIAVTRDMRLELQDVAKGSNLAPDQVRLKRMGKNLWLYFDGSEVADVVLDDYYSNDSDAKGEPPVLAGYAENGEAYEYIPQDPEVSSLSGALKEGNVPVIMSLGGGALGGFELSALPLVAAAGGGIGGLLLGGAALAAAAAGGGGGGGGTAASVVPSGQTGHLTHDAVNDTGASATDSYTKNTNPKYTGTAEKGATVVVTVNGVDYTTTASATDGSYSVDLTNGGKALPDGVYTPIIKVTNSAGTSSANGEAFTVDSSDSTNQDAKKSPSTQNDVNHNDNATVNTTSIVSIDTDTGVSATDFNTSDNTLTFTGQVKGFIANGDLLHVQVVKSDGTVAIDTYVTPSATGAWSLDNTSKTLENGSYTIKATLEDLAGNPVNPTVTHALVIESVAPTPTPLPIGTELSITAITDDTGTSASDFKTSDHTLTISGATNLPAGSTVQVFVQVLAADGHTVVRSGYATIDTNQHTWTFVADANGATTSLPNGSYTITASYRTAAGNELDFHAVDHDLFIADSGLDALKVVADTASVTEGAPLTTTDATGVLANDGDTLATSLVVTKVEKGASIDSSASAVASTDKTTIVGEYGQLDMFADGHYVYTPDGHLPAGQTGVDHFSYQATAGTGTSARSKTTTLDITVTGVNDAAVMSLLNHKAVEINDNTTYANAIGPNNKPITITDKDTGEAVIQGLNSTANATTETQGSLGTLTMTADGAGAYGFSYQKDTSKATVIADTNQHDLYSFTSKDGTANETLDFVLKGSGTITKQVFNVNPLGTEHLVSGLTVVGDTSTTVTDTLVLHGSSTSSQQTTFDFTDPTATTFTSIEKIDIQGAGPNVLKLSLASLIQSDTANSVSQTLYVNGDSNDTVDYHSVTSSSTVVNHDATDRVVDGITYHVYHIGNDELLVQSTIANISVHS
jgi:VCBS repeat-containing protein